MIKAFLLEKYILPFESATFPTLVARKNWNLANTKYSSFDGEILSGYFVFSHSLKPSKYKFCHLWFIANFDEFLPVCLLETLALAQNYERWVKWSIPFGRSLNLWIPASDICREQIPIWVTFDGLNIPKTAVKGGGDVTQNFYIGRAKHHGSVTPGRVLEIDKTCLIPWGTVSNTKTEFDILTCSGENSWVAQENGLVPTNAFHAGQSEQGETLYIGRVWHERKLLVGKVQTSHRVCYVAFDGKELNFKRYEVLVVWAVIS